MKEMCPHVRYAVEQALHGLIHAEGPDFADMIEAVGREIVYIRAGISGEYPRGAAEAMAIERASCEVVNAYHALFDEYRLYR